MRVALDLCEAVDLDEDSQRTIYNALRRAPAMRKLKHKPVCSVLALNRLQRGAEDIQTLQKTQKLQRAAVLIQSAFRSYQAKQALTSSLAEYQQGKIALFYELCDKEKRFVMNLATLVSQYIVPLRVSSDKQLKKISGDLTAVFSNVESILEVHQNLLKALYAVQRDQWPHLRGLGDAFTCISPSLAIYGKYVHNFKFALDTLDECCDQNEHFAEFLERKSATLSLDLTLLLSLPLNHIAGYEHFLKGILEVTPEPDPEHHSLLQAITITTETANFIANALGQAQNIASICKTFKNIATSPQKESLFEELSANHSTLVHHEKSLDLLLPGLKKPTPASLYIFDDIAFAAILGGHRGDTIRCIWHLSHCSVQLLPAPTIGISLFIEDEEKPEYDREVEDTRFNFGTENEDQSNSLLQTIQGLIDHNKRNKSTL